MRRFLRSTLSNAAYRAIRMTNGQQPVLRILTYHRVTDAHPGDRLCVPVRQFEAQMRHLAVSGVHTLTFAEAVRWVQRGGVLPQRAVAITFDDGFEDNYRYAYPALVRHRFTGCFFVPSRFVAVGADSHHVEDRPMTWAQLDELLRQGHEVGAHSVTHRHLTRLSLHNAMWEASESKHTLEHYLKRPVNFFCYPSGDYDELVKLAVKESGYLGACTVEPGVNRPGDDPFALKRTEISGFDTLWDFEKKLAGAYDWMHRLVQGAQR